MENSYLILLSVIQAIIIVALVLYFLKFKKKDNEIEEIKNHPDFIKSDAEVRSLSEQLNTAKGRIDSLETDKKDQLKLIEM